MTTPSMWTLQDAAGAMFGHLRPSAHDQIPVQGACIDSRSVRPGALFFALPGERTDGHDFVAQALSAGAAGAVIARERMRQAEGPLIRVDDPALALWRWSRAHRQRLSARVIGITGSNGKTTTKELLGQLLKGHKRVVVPPHSFNNHLGVPLTLLEADGETEVLVVEMGTSGPGEIARLAGLVRPDIGVLTSVGPTHLAGLGSIEDVHREKAALAEALSEEGCLVVNANDGRTRQTGAGHPGPTWYVGVGDRSPGLLPGAAGVVWGEGLHHAGAGSALTVVRAASEGGLTAHPGTTPLIGQHGVRNALLALTVAQLLGVELSALVAGLARLQTAPGRLRREQLGGIELVDDAYNANPASMAAAINVLKSRPGRRRILVAGDMRELGETSPRWHRAIGRRAARAGLDLVVAVGSEARHILLGAAAGGMGKDQLVHFQHPEAAGLWLAGRLEGGDAVLFKASRSVGLERAIETVRAFRAQPGREAG